MIQLTRIASFFFSCYAFLVFLFLLILVFPLAVIASLFGKVKGGNFIYRLCRLWSSSLFLLTCIRTRLLYETAHDASRSYVFVFNHISYLDIPALLVAIRGQHFRVLGKAELAKIPVFGFIYRSAAVLVQRNVPVHRAKSVLTLKSVLNKSISVVISPEGTFNTTGQPLKDFYDGAFRIAIETRTPVKPILFPDNFDRLNYHSVFSLRPGLMRAVFLEEISTAGLAAEDIPALKLKVYSIMQEGLQRYRASWIQTGERKR